MSDSELLAEIHDKIYRIEEALNDLEAEIARLHIDRLCICGWVLMRRGLSLHCGNESCSKYDPEILTKQQ